MKRIFNTVAVLLICGAMLTPSIDARGRNNSGQSTPQRTTTPATRPGNMGRPSTTPSTRPSTPNSLQGRHSPPSPHNRTNLRSPTARTSLTNPDNPTAHRRATTVPAETTVPATIPGRRSKAITGLAATRDSEARAPNAPATVRPLLRPRALIRARCVPTCHRLTHGTALLHLPDGVFPVRGVRSARYWASHSAPP